MGFRMNNSPDAVESSPGGPSRRKFLEVVVGVLSSLVGAAVAIPFLGNLIGGRSRAGQNDFSPVAPVESLPLGRPADVAYSAMTTDAYIREDDVHHLWVVRRSDSEVIVYSPVCPHLGCRYDWDPQDSLFKCPCHGSVFTIDGRVVAGPAPRPLDTLPAEVRQGRLYVKWERFRVGTTRKIRV
jgi:menaquinol-cytochrome c reductase iron-sulfur subunit